MSNQLQLIRTTIGKLVEGKLTTYEWDDNISGKCKDRPAEALRQIALHIPDLFPPSKRQDYCSEKGIEFLRLLIKWTEEEAKG